ncbi:MAG: exosortase/archaeosortase family protein [bacterium]
MIPRIRSHASPRQLAALALAWAVPFLLFAFLPYSQGYGEVPESALKQLFNISRDSGDWGHCLIVLPLAFGLFVFAIYQNPLPPPSPSRLGVILMILSFLFFWIGHRMGTHYIGFFAFQGMVAGSIWFLLGWRTVVFFGFPLVFLVFAWPLPFLDNYIAFPLRMLMSHAAVFFLDSVGIEVVRSGTGILSAPDPLLGIPAGKKFAVDVADPCSGIRSLFSLMMASALYGQMKLHTWWQKWILFVCSAPLAIVGNLARILMLTIGTVVFGAEFAIGKSALSDPSWFHLVAGYLVFIVAIGGMVLIAQGLLHLREIRAGFSLAAQSVRASLSALQSPPPRTPSLPSSKQTSDEY